ncbi:MAG: 1-(5-phosphoribosyl)-5-[(5-phosphoribosylamino)methylideneamino]imidazole-4-carboxamide isomerase [Planctomycetes bacterium]|nr:1-(5-phosphoribosyl)-5-[(5-phosphoribosylamino)methylideneamino]imidazole-4-carboxamide isomerase [Planctomycetota bacterium]MCK5472988.1 1-(5-phosphoribosyl)-5-[(5-phosphoribosylamino)methylideneamino]imidazole-4-carboxamide isomerase [Planctomycetota bacterium]
MYIIPAIDLLKGRCVRLIQGEYHRRIDYQDDPVTQAEQFSEAGAEWLHIVDLDGAKAGKPVNTGTISAIAALGLLKIEVGGGLRDEKSIEQLLEIGVERVIIGTKAVSDFRWFKEMTEKFSGKIALGIDARGSKVATHGWTQDSTQDLIDFAVKASKLPIAAIIYTDITKDGMMTGPNFERTKALVDAVDVPVIASGGVGSVADIRQLAKLGVDAAIVGRSLYEGTLELSEAIEAAK